MEIAVRGGRKMEERGATTGEDGVGQLPAVTLFLKARMGLAFGSPWKPQHQQMPLQVSGWAGSGYLASGCGEEDEATTKGPSQ